MSARPIKVARVRLRFGPGDEDAYAGARKVLLQELDGWLDLPEIERSGTVANVGFVLDWRYHDSNGVLDDFAPSDIAELMLQWCPPRLTGRPEIVPFVCDAVRIYLDFMAATGRLVGGRKRATRLIELVGDLTPALLAEVQGSSSVGDDPEQQQHTYELPFVYLPPPATEVEVAAAGAPLLAKFKALCAYLGSDGKQLTENGNLNLADGRALVDLLETGDEMDMQLGDTTISAKSTRSLRRLSFIVFFAREAGAVRVRQGRLVPVKAWASRRPVQQAEALFAALVERGPLEVEFSGPSLYSLDLRELLDDGIVHWLAPLLAPGAAERFDAVVEWAESAATTKHELLDPDDEWNCESIEEDMSRIFEVLEDAGVVRWIDRQEVPEPFGPTFWNGGTVALTAFGRHVLPDYLGAAGYVLRRAEDVVHADAAALIETLFSASDTDRETLIAAWQAERPTAERVQMLTEAIVAASDGASRGMALSVLEHFDIDVTEPFVRQLLDTPVAGHAALWLMSQGRADAETLGSFIDVAVIVDVLAAGVDDLKELCEFFGSFTEPLGLLEDIWRHPAPETAVVLDALGNNLQDKTLAKAARKAAVKHRSWMANRQVINE